MGKAETKQTNEMILPIKDIISILNSSNLEIQGTEVYDYTIPYDLKPIDFLKFAEIDINTKINHHQVNALSNAKRALDCQVLCLLEIFGLKEIADKKRWGFPKKVEALTRLGILAPRILNKINRTRNLLEHEFTQPNDEQVTDFIDIVSLFIESTKKYIENYIYLIETNWIEDKCLTITIDKNGINIDFFYDKDRGDESLEWEKMKIEPNSDNFYQIMEIFHQITSKVY